MVKKVSIITPSLNSEKTIGQTICSVIHQTYQDIEYIIIDGGSTDATLGIVKKYEDKIAKVISGQDKGIFDAMNKGIKMAAGEVIGILNSDDFYASRDVIEKVAKAFEEENCDCLWGDLVYIDRENTEKVVRYWKSSKYGKGKFQMGWHPPHPTFFVKREIYQTYGVFRLDFPISADYELMLRFLERWKIRSCYIPQVLVKMREGGNSNWKSVKRVLKGNLEAYRAFKINGLKVNPSIVFIKPLLKAKQLSKGRY